MSNYTKATNFTQKDGLSSGDPNKIIKGSEIDVEYSAIASAVNSKADSDSPTFTVTPAATMDKIAAPGKAKATGYPEPKAPAMISTSNKRKNNSIFALSEK